MPLRTRSQAQRYFRSLARPMGLADWTIVVDGGPPPDESAMASVRCTPGQKHARVWLAGDFFRSSPEEQRHSACHELIHCHHAHADHLADGFLGDEAFDAWVLAMEYAVDGVAAGYARLLPVPK